MWEKINWAKIFDEKISCDLVYGGKDSFEKNSSELISGETHSLTHFFTNSE